MTASELDKLADKAKREARDELRGLLSRETPPYRIKKLVDSIVEAATHRAEARLVRRLIGQAEADTAFADSLKRMGLGALVGEAPDAEGE